MATETVTSLPKTVNLNLYRGDDFVMTLTVTDDEGEAIDLSTADVMAQVRATPDAADIAGEFDAVTSDNVITLHLPWDVSATLPLRGVWDCRVEIDRTVTTLAAGTLNLTADVTRP